MKGRLNKLSRGWVVEYVFPGPPFVGELPILMDDNSESLILGDEVNFKIVEQWEIGDFDMEGMVEYAEIIPKVEKEEPYNYWKERCLAAEKFINLSPCDHDIYNDQLIAYTDWITIKLKQTN